MLDILTVILPLFIIIFASALLRRLNVIKDNWSAVLNEFALKVGLPVFLFSALSKAPFSFSEQATLIIANTIFIAAVFLLAWLLSKALHLNGQMSRTIVMCSLFGNIGYLGIPVLTQVGDQSVLHAASLVVAVYNFWIFSVVIGYIDSTLHREDKGILRGAISNLCKNPLLIAVVLGTVVAGFHVPVPGVITKSLDMISASGTPTVLIVIGLFIGQSKIGGIKEWVPIFAFSLSKLMILPALFFYGVCLFGSPAHNYLVSIIEAAMPLAITPFALADRYDLNKEFIMRSIVLSTILSVVSLTFWVAVTST
jgi:predicted permease